MKIFRILALGLVLLIPWPGHSTRRVAMNVVEVHAGRVEDFNKVRTLAYSLDFTKQAMPTWWRITVLNEADWQDTISRYHLEGQTDTAFSILGLNQTFLREQYVFLGRNEDVRHTIAHEAGHLICVCSSEDTANRIAKKLEEK